jgi:hypothetical protein
MVLSFSVTDMACDGTKCPVDFHVDDMKGRRLGSFKACKTCRIMSGLSHVRVFLNPSVCCSQALPPAYSFGGVSHTCLDALLLLSLHEAAKTPAAVGPDILGEIR